MFLGDVQCVYCRCKVIFSGNDISYQNQQCASHNQEHQFPGMNIIIKSISSFNTHLPANPLMNFITSQRKYPNILKSRVTGGVLPKLHRHKNKDDLSREEFKQWHSLQETYLDQQDYKSGKNTLWV